MFRRPAACPSICACQAAPSSPLVAGTIELHGVTVMGMALGDAILNLSALESGIAVKGTLFNRFTVDATAQLTSAGLRAKGNLVFTHLVLEDLALQAPGQSRDCGTGPAAEGP